MPKELSQQGLDFIKSQEGFKDHIYLDKVNKPTIGYGHLVLPNEIAEYQGMTITESQGEAILREDVASVVNELNDLCLHYQINFEQYQFDMICSLLFNTGGIEKKPSMQHAFMNKNIAAIGNDITLYNEAGGKVLKDLQERRAKEQQIYFKGY